MAKLSKHELREAILGDESLSEDVKGQLLDLLKTPTFGLVWEEKTEDVIERLRDELPILKEVKERAIISADKDAPNHVLIEADNLEALVALTYTHAGKFDAIYIDPPYNTGATDWKYNNDYVDKEDAYRHSKWLCMMEHRLQIAKRLLNRENSVLAVTIDEKEYLHIGCLLEQMFPDVRQQMVTTIIKPEGTNRFNEFSRTNEFIYYVVFGDAEIVPGKTSMFDMKERNIDEGQELPKLQIEWRNMRRRGDASERRLRPNQFYPIFINKETLRIESVGEALPIEVDKSTIIPPENCYALFPLSPDGTETMWSKHYETAKELLEKGYMRVKDANNPQKAHIEYLPTGTVEDIEQGNIIIEGRGEQGEVIGHYKESLKLVMPKTVWYMPTHNAQTNGSLLIKKILGENLFSFPKSLYAVRDTLAFYVSKKPNAKILDFFAGSGTTMHATMMLNQEDGGHRQCFLVTNNENKICEEVTYERNRRVIQGYTTPKGEQVAGLTSNNLRYYRVEHTPRKHTHENKMLLAQAMTEMLQIKWNAYDEPERFGSLRVKPRYMRYFSGDEDVLIIYVPEIIPYIVKEIKAMDNGKKLHVYVAADGNYAYSEEFGEVMKRIELASIPSAYYNAIKSILPAPTEEKGEYVPSEEDEELLAHADKHDFQD